MCLLCPVIVHKLYFTNIFVKSAKIRIDEISIFSDKIVKNCQKPIIFKIISSKDPWTNLLDFFLWILLAIMVIYGNLTKVCTSKKGKNKPPFNPYA